MSNVESIKKALEGVTSAFNRVLAEAPADAYQFSIGFDCQGQAIRIDLADMRAITELLTALEALQRENGELRKAAEARQSELCQMLTRTEENVVSQIRRAVLAENEEKRLREALEEIRDEDSYEKRESFDDSGKHITRTVYGDFGEIARTALASAGEHHAE